MSDSVLDRYLKRSRSRLSFLNSSLKAKWPLS